MTLQLTHFTLEPEETHWAYEPAPQEAVDYVLKQPINPDNNDGRSNWVWIRLPHGDLVLAVFPQGDTYFSTEEWRTI